MSAPLTIAEALADCGKLEADLRAALRAYEIANPGVRIDYVHFQRCREIGPDHDKIESVEVGASLVKPKPTKTASVW